MSARRQSKDFPTWAACLFTLSFLLLAAFALEAVQELVLR